MIFLFDCLNSFVDKLRKRGWEYIFFLFWKLKKPSNIAIIVKIIPPFFIKPYWVQVHIWHWKILADLAIIEKTLALFRKISGNSGQWRLKKRRKRESVQQQWNFSVKIKQWKINWSNFKPIYFLSWILKKSKKPSKSDFQAWILPKKCATQLLKIWQFVCPNSPEKLYSPVNKWRDLFLLMFSPEISSKTPSKFLTSD